MGKQWGCEFLSTEVRVVADRDSDFLSGPYFTGMVNRVGAMAEWNRLCDASFDWPPNELVCRCMLMCGKNIVTVFKLCGNEGENNMGKLTIDLVNFMTQTCGWGLHLCNGTNLGFYGQIREQQVIFKAPHPLNLTAPHLMIELRQAGYVEINGVDNNGIFEKLSEWPEQKWEARRVQADPGYCAFKFACKVFSKRGREGENNMGMRTMEIVDFMVQRRAWTIVTCNGGNFGRYGDLREQQMVFRDDGHVQHGEDHIMVELRDIGYVEVNGLSS